MKQIAIIGPTACGKSDLALNIAKKYNGIVLSLDSLSIYKQIDIASAKPTCEERGDVPHVGIDEIYPNEPFNVMLFLNLYKKANNLASERNAPLIIVGGTSFYLKSMVEGMSLKPQISVHVKEEVQKRLEDLSSVQELVTKTDPLYKAELNDRYRLEKWLEVYLESGEVPSTYLQKTKQEPLIKNIDIFEIETDREVLRQKIALRTQKMLDLGLVDEVKMLLQTYGKEPLCMKSIGIKEVIEFLEGKCSLEQMSQWITIHTAQLAKRQRTFNSSQFKNVTKLPLCELSDKIQLALAD